LLQCLKNWLDYGQTWEYKKISSTFLWRQV
jgi:hypothetical protein